MKKKYLYMLVTKDKYELPLVVADSISQLARELSISPNVIRSAMSKAKNVINACM